MIKRKTTTYLNSIRRALQETHRELYELAVDIGDVATDLNNWHFTEVTTDGYKADFKELDRLYKAFGKHIKMLKAESEKYRQFLL